MKFGSVNAMAAFLYAKFPIRIIDALSEVISQLHGSFGRTISFMVRICAADTSNFLHFVKHLD